MSTYPQGKSLWRVEAVLFNPLTLRAAGPAATQSLPV